MHAFDPTVGNQPANIHRYQILRRLGRGGMGIVYLAHDPIIGRDVAIKVLRTLDEPGLFERFQREIRIAGALSHPSIVRIYDAGEIDEQPFVAMEYIPGQTLDALIKQAAPLDLNKKLGLLIDLALGLAYAHANKVVHRDIKPSNLIVDEHERLKILDFGVARFAGSGFTSHIAVGTPGYMSPEQLQGHSADMRSDIFAVGVVMYEFIAYRRPFAGKEVAAVYHRILHEEPRPLGLVAPGVPAGLERLIARCLDKDRDSRLQDAVALASGLREQRDALTDEETTLTASGLGLEARAEFPSAPSTPKRIASSTARRVADLRRRVLQEAKDTSRDAHRRGDYVRAVDAAEHALVIDASDDEAGALLAQARAGLDRQTIETLLDAARDHIANGRLDDASRTLDQAAPYIPALPEFSAIERTIRAELTTHRTGGAPAAMGDDDADEAEREPDDPTVPVLIADLPSHVGETTVPVLDVAPALSDPASAATLKWHDVEALPPLPVAPAATVDRPVWGRSVDAGATRGVNAMGWAISAGAHTALALAIGVIVLGSYTLAQPPVEVPLHAVIPIELAPPPPVPPPIERRASVPSTPNPQPHVSQPPRSAATNDEAPQVIPPLPAPAAPVIAPNAINPEDLTRTLTSFPASSAPAAPPGPPASIDERPVNDADQRPVLVTTVQPAVPEGASGRVRVEVTIASDGRVTRVRLLDDTPYGALILAAAEKCKFRPARRRGRPVAVNDIITFDLSTDR
jgi:TonB family protein